MRLSLAITASGVSSCAKKRYVAGFLFSHDSSRVVLILKERPDWQKGFLNGVGGKIEAGESPAEAMRREFREEAGLDLADWQEFCLLSGEDWCVHWFRKWLPEGGDDLLSQETDEVVLWCPIEFLGTGNFRTLTNLGWLIPLALDSKVERSLVHGA